MTEDLGSCLPDWAAGMADLHAHAAPSLMPRHHDDRNMVAAEQSVGFTTVVLKAHEGSTVERAAAAGPDVYGGIVLNSTVGGANPDAVEVSARLGGRVVWMPTISSRAHQAAAASPELSLHREFTLQPVDVLDDGKLRDEWYAVLDIVASHDLLLASGHLSASETVVLFREARRRGVERLLVNHPKMAFLHWDQEASQMLEQLGAYLELGILPDLIGGDGHSCLSLVDTYPKTLLAFGSDLGHVDHPSPVDGVAPWLRRLEKRVGEKDAVQIMTTQTKNLLLA